MLDVEKLREPQISRVLKELIRVNVKHWVAADVYKVPINPFTGYGAKANDSSTWGTWYDAYKYASTMKDTKGVGFELGVEPIGYVVIDLDHVIHDGNVEDYAAEIIRLMDSYTEISQSGTGIHILCKSNKTLHEMNSGIDTGFNQNGVEVYDSRKYFILTGEIYGEAKEIRERTAQLEQIVAKYFTPKSKSQPQPTQQQQVTFTPPNKSDAELWEVMFNSEAGDKIRRLYSGDISGYTSFHNDGKEYLNPNAADLALCRYLAFYTGSDYSRIESMFEQSALSNRDKWKMRPDYRQRTINKAIVSTYEGYTGKQENQQQTPATPAKPRSKKQAVLERLFSNPLYGKRFKSLYDDNIDVSEYPYRNKAISAFLSYLALECGDDEELIYDLYFESKLYSDDDWQDNEKCIDYHDDIREYILDAIKKAKDYLQEQQQQTPEYQEVQEVQKPRIEFSFNADYVDSSFESDIKTFQCYSKRKTGFSNLDDRLTIYPGLYVFGAVSSLGKTTFNLQLADYLAQSGEHVLYFALEQSRFELVSKSLARLCQPEGKFYDSAPSAIEIRNGRITPELRGAIKKYKEIAKHYSIIECDFETTVTTIIKKINAYIQQYGVKPVVFIDYLQLVRSDDSKLKNAKDVVDDVIRALKKFQMKNELVMFVISSLNRQNYLTTIDFESFKETGGIEYTADCLMGLQLAVMNASLFETDTKTGEKRKVVKAAKRENPRNIELCILKNRYGVSNETFYFHYYPKWDLFIPAKLETIKEAVKSLVESVTKKQAKKQR